MQLSCHTNDCQWKKQAYIGENSSLYDEGTGAVGTPRCLTGTSIWYGKPADNSPTFQSAAIDHKLVDQAVKVPLRALCMSNISRLQLLFRSEPRNLSTSYLHNLAPSLVVGSFGLGCSDKRKPLSSQPRAATLCRHGLEGMTDQVPMAQE